MHAHDEHVTRLIRHEYGETNDGLDPSRGFINAVLIYAILGVVGYGLWRFIR